MNIQTAQRIPPAPAANPTTPIITQTIMESKKIVIVKVTSGEQLGYFKVKGCGTGGGGVTYCSHFSSTSMLFTKRVKNIQMSGVMPRYRHSKTVAFRILAFLPPFQHFQEIKGKGCLSQGSEEAPQAPPPSHAPVALEQRQAPQAHRTAVYVKLCKVKKRAGVFYDVFNQQTKSSVLYLTNAKRTNGFIKLVPIWLLKDTYQSNRKLFIRLSILLKIIKHA